MKVYNYKDAYPHLQYVLKTGKEDAFIAVITDTVVHFGEEGGFNPDVAEALNIPYYNIHKKGGAMVTSPGDVVYCFTSKKDNLRFNAKLCDFLSKKLSDKQIPITKEKNDLLADGRKFLGYMQKNLPHISYYGGHISINCNLSLIQQICTKTMQKVPCGLGEFGITTEEVIKWIQEFYFYFK